MQKTIGGDRLGSGQDMKTELNNYGRSTHNLSQSWKSSLAPGVLYPFLCIPATNGDNFEIDLDYFARTIPTKGPLFGQFKMQMDVFSVPMRLYQGILHNNPINIGLNMNKVLLPKIKLKHVAGNRNAKSFQSSQVANNALLKYLGISGIGQNAAGTAQPEAYVERDFNAVPILAYYDIFKNYYANKQEEDAYVLCPQDFVDIPTKVTKITATGYGSTTSYNAGDNVPALEFVIYRIYGEALSTTDVKILIDDNEYTLENCIQQGKINLEYVESDNKGLFTMFKITCNTSFVNECERHSNGEFIVEYSGNSITAADIRLKDFPLENIDKMRMQLLSSNELNSQFYIDTNSVAPYCYLAKQDKNGKTFNSYAQNGLLVKTYQSDLFNNWLNTEWIDGENGIAAVTAIDTSDGSFTIDELNMMSKVYNMLNRVAVAGGTYQDWQEAVYSEQVIRHAETPIYMGGASCEIMFEEVISTAESAGANEQQPLGTLGGKGTIQSKKGGKLDIDIKEPSFIIGIVSLTPRVDYTQGNEWYMTELNSIDDLHKPALDAIGFQDLMTERLAWWDTIIAPNSSSIVRRSAVGKVPAWIEYQTAVDKAYGDFAADEGKNYMILGRNYEIAEDGSVGDVTTYIDPSKFNYAFAYTELDAQNFWVQIMSHIKARRVMSAKIIPNL